VSGTSTANSAALVSRALAPHRDRLARDSVAFTRASLAMAKAQLGSRGAANAASPRRDATLQALAKWQDEVARALKSVRAVDGHATGRRKAVGWLTTLQHALESIRKAMTLSDARAAAKAAKAAQHEFDVAHGLAAQLAKVLA